MDSQAQVLRAGTITLFPAEWLVTVGRAEVSLTRTEFLILRELLKAEGRVLTRDDLLQLVWGVAGVTDRTVDVHLSRMRTKLEDAGSTVITVHGVGYRIRVDSSR